MKRIVALSIFFLLLITLPVYVFAQIDDIQPDEVRLNVITDIESTSQTTTAITGEHIKDFDVSITINKDATINVLEKIKYDFDGLEKHGIYRTIPYIKVNKDGKKYRMILNNFTVNDETGQAYSYTQSDDGTNIQLKIGDANKLITGFHTYVIKYTVAGAITYFSDHDELYWNVTGNEWLVPIVRSTTLVSLPVEIPEKDIKVICFTGSAGTNSSTCQVAKRGNQTTILTTQTLNSQEGLTFALSLPMNVVAHLEAKEVINFWDTFFGRLLGKIISLLITLAVLFWYIIYPIKIIVGWWRYGRDPKGITGEVRAWFDPPKNKNGRELTPVETGSIVDEKVDLRDISASIVDLARRGYFKIEERKKNDFYFVKQKKYINDSNLLLFEKKLLDEFFVLSDSFRIKGSQLASGITEVGNQVYDQLVKDGFFPKNPNSIRTFYSVIGVLALMTVNLPLALIAFTFGRAMPRKTIAGVDASNVAKSLKNFLTSQERQLKFLVEKADLPAGRQVMFEKLLPYAVAFGVERIWAQRFKDMQLKQPDWYSSYDSTRGFNSVIFANSLGSSMSSFRSAATPVSSTTGHSSGFSGGFSGGGGGGGGGGSW